MNYLKKFYMIGHVVTKCIIYNTLNNQQCVVCVGAGVCAFSVGDASVRLEAA